MEKKWKLNENNIIIYSLTMTIIQQWFELKNSF